MERGIAISVSSYRHETFSNVPVMSTSLDDKGCTIGIAIIRGIMIEVRQSSKDWRNWQIIDEAYEDLEDLEVHHCVTQWGHRDDIVEVVNELKTAYQALSMPVNFWRIPFAKENIKHQRVFKVSLDGELALIDANATVHVTHTDENGREHGYSVFGNALYKFTKTDQDSWIF